MILKVGVFEDMARMRIGNYKPLPPPVFALRTRTCTGVLCHRSGCRVRRSDSPALFFGSMAGSAEYGVLIRHTGDLKLAVRPNLTSLGANLLGAEIITTDQYDDIRNAQRSVNDRAADLVRYVQDKVSQNRQHYYAFIGALKKDESEYRDILAKLEESLKRGAQPSREGGDRQPIPTVPTRGITILSYMLCSSLL